jgi:hypothetical protein
MHTEIEIVIGLFDLLGLEFCALLVAFSRQTRLVICSEMYAYRTPRGPSPKQDECVVQALAPMRTDGS